MLAVMSRACCSDSGSRAAGRGRRRNAANVFSCARAACEYTMRWLIVPLPSPLTFSTVVIWKQAVEVECDEQEHGAAKRSMDGCHGTTMPQIVDGAVRI